MQQRRAETIELAAELGFGYSAVFITRTKALALNQKLRERAVHYGHSIRSDQTPILAQVYVAETQERAEEEYIEHLRFHFEDALRTTPQFLAPPGYLSVTELKARAGADKMHGGFDFKALQESSFVAVGSPDQVANTLGEWSEMMGSRHFNINFHVGNMPNWKVVKNLSLFASEVIPRLRGTAPSAVAGAYQPKLA
jgi:alkanesulfonate monooxygenase SsuD/methylene tetrahydromethanopterin reductase-like flavin-dependent oxidoreductase (luciferase family)